jgi:hypothetical protein
LLLFLPLIFGVVFTVDFWCCFLVFLVPFFMLQDRQKIITLLGAEELSLTLSVVRLIAQSDPSLVTSSPTCSFARVRSLVLGLVEKYSDLTK